MKRVISISLGVLLSLTALNPVFGQQVPSLDELIEEATRKNYTLANKRLEIESAQIDRQKIKEVYLPSVDLSGKYAYLASGINVKAPANSVPELGIALPAMDDAFTNTANLITGQIHAEAILYTGGKAPYLKKALDEKIHAQTALVEKERQEIIANVATAYDQLALLKQARIVLNESQKRLDINAKTADKALGYGIITPYEHQKVEVAQAQLEAKVTQYEGQRKLLLELLHQYTGVSPDRLALIDHELVPALPVATGNTIENRAEITALNAGVRAREYQIKAAQTWWKPKVVASASVGYLNMFDIRLKAREPFPTGNTMSLSTNKLELVPNTSVGIGFKWDLFDGNKGKRETQQARIEMKKTLNEREEALEKLALNLIKNETAYSNALSDVRAREKQRQSARNALTLATKEFKTGLIKAADLIGAETDFQNASLDYLQAVYQQRRTVADLLQSTGSLTAQTIR